MASYLSKNQEFHIFSKSPIRGNMALAEAVNKSGHTILSSEVRADDIPWFVKVPNVDDIPDYVTSRGLTLNDIVFAGNYSLSGTGGIQAKIYKGDNNWESLDISTSPTLYNKDGKAVIQVHYNAEIEYITGNENAGISSDRWAAFIKSETKENERVYQFVSSTDKVYKGIPSLGYTAYIESNNKKVYEGANDNDYIVNAFAGIIQFNKQRGETESLRGIIFEYIGDHISDNIAALDDDLDKHITDDTEHIKNINGDAYIAAGLNDDKDGFEISLNVATTISDSVNGTNKVANYNATKSYVDNLKNTKHNQSVTKNGVTVQLTGTLGNPVIGLGVSHNNTIDDSTSKSLTAPTTKAVHSFVNDAISGAVTSHTNNTDILHVTTKEKAKWNTAASEISALLKVETDVINDNKKYALMMTAESSDITLTNNQFKHPLTSLVIGDGLFADNSTITKFESNLPNLTYAESMFSGCTALTSFNVGLHNLSNLVTGTDMFKGCTNLVSFNGNLSSLSSASGMFAGCNNLSANSISMIVSSIKDWSKETDDTAEHKIGIPISSNDENYAKLIAKGWTIE